MTPRTSKGHGTGFDLSAYKELYLEEARKCLATLRQNLVLLRDDAANETALQEAHRAAHTLKGMSATMHYETLTTLAKELEDPLYRSDEAKLPLPSDQIQTLFARCDDFEAALDRRAQEKTPENIER
jgi:two-component system chemotaxis sensor kinase CheA